MGGQFRVIFVFICVSSPDIGRQRNDLMGSGFYEDHGIHREMQTKSHQQVNEGHR